jgi:hypothetical protein
VVVLLHITDVAEVLLVYHTTQTVFDRLEDEGIDVPEEDRYYPYRPTYDWKYVWRNRSWLFHLC